MKKSCILFFVSATISLIQPVFAITGLNSGFQSEVYFRYSTTAIGSAMDSTFDSNGNLYVAHTFGGSARNGSIQKISPSKAITPLVSSLVDPRYVTWGGGSSLFGDNLYVADRQEVAHWSTGEITRVDLAGNKTAFCGGVNQPTALAIESSGSFLNYLYAANSAHDNIVAVDSARKIVTTFSPYPYNASGSILDMAFDTNNRYGGSLFAGNYSTSQYGGLFSINAAGNAAKYADLVEASAVAFDDTAVQSFDGKMYVAGKTTHEDTQWTLFQVNGMNDYSVFATFDLSSSWTRPDILFGDDGAMYVMEWNGTTRENVISRITPIPEPASLLLITSGALFIRRKR